MGKTLAGITQNDRENIRAALSDFRDARLAKIRAWYEQRLVGDLKSIGNGVYLQLRHLPEIIQWLSEIGPTLNAAGMTARRPRFDVVRFMARALPCRVGKLPWKDRRDGNRRRSIVSRLSSS
jgi:hypothetical protein